MVNALVVYNGYKVFGKFKCKILIINHPEQRCLEVIVFDPFLEYQSTRMYLKSDFLSSKISTKMFNDTLRIKTRAAERLKKQVNVSKLMTDITTNMVIAIIIGRLRCEELPGLQGSCLFFLKPTVSDKTVKVQNGLKTLIDFEYLSMPDRLVPYDLPPSTKIR